MIEKLEKKDYQSKISSLISSLKEGVGKEGVDQEEQIKQELEGFIQKFYIEEEGYYILKKEYREYEKEKEGFEERMSDEGFNGETEDETNDERREDFEKLMEDQENKIREYEDLLRRNQADFDNYKKRTLRQWDDFRIRSSQTLLEKLLPIMDNLEKAREAEVDMSLKDGTLLIEKQMRKLLSDEKVEKIESEGKEFNPSEHEAVHIEESDNDYKVDMVIKEWQSGYKFGGKVIRAAKVVVAKGGVKGEEREGRGKQNKSEEGSNKVHGRKME